MNYFYTILISIVFCLLGYLLGNILFGEIFTKAKKINIRDIGSGNVGGTNVSRVNKKLGILVILLDALKSYLAVILCWAIFIGTIKNFFNLHHISLLYSLVYLGGLFAIIGHCFPLKYLIAKISKNFDLNQIHQLSGGKGVSCIIGLFFAYNFVIGIIAGIIWFSVLLISKYVSLSSIISVALAPCFIFIKWVQFPYLFANNIFDNSFLIFVNSSYSNSIFFFLIVFLINILGSVIVIIRHKPNIILLFNHSERRIGSKK